LRLGQCSPKKANKKRHEVKTKKTNPERKVKSNSLGSAPPEERAKESSRRKKTRNVEKRGGVKRKRVKEDAALQGSLRNFQAAGRIP